MTSNDMINDLKRDRDLRDAEIKRIVAERDPELIKEGIETYNRDLPRLLDAKKENYHVAYRGNSRIGIAPTREKLKKLLASKNYTKRGELFITKIERDVDNEGQGR